MKYSTFELHLSVSGEFEHDLPETVTVKARFNVKGLDGGETEAADEGFVKLERSPLWELLRRFRQHDLKAEELTGLGDRLASVLLPKTVIGQFHRWVGSRGLQDPQDVDGEGDRVRLRLVFEESAISLARLPWEYVWVESFPQPHLLLDRRFSMVRSWNQRGQQLRFLRKSAESLAVAYASATKDMSLPPLQVAALEYEVIEKVHDVSFRRIGDDPVTGEQIKAGLAKGQRPADVFHFSGHGSSSSSALLVRKAEPGTTETINAHDLSKLLRNVKASVAFLSSCGSGMAERPDEWGLGADLARGGIPTVLAMQEAVGDKPASSFSAAFYECLAEHHGIDRLSVVDDAVSAGRLAIADETSWGIPVLYSCASVKEPVGAVRNPGSALQKTGQRRPRKTKATARRASYGRIRTLGGPLDKVGGLWSVLSVGGSLLLFEANDGVLTKRRFGATRYAVSTHVGIEVSSLAVTQDGSAIAFGGEGVLSVAEITTAADFVPWASTIPVDGASVLAARRRGPSIDILVGGTHGTSSIRVDPGGAHRTMKTNSAAVSSQLAMLDYLGQLVSSDEIGSPLLTEGAGHWVDVDASVHGGDVTVAALGRFMKGTGAHLCVVRQVSGENQRRVIDIGEPVEHVRVARNPGLDSAPTTIVLQSGNVLRLLTWDELPVEA